MRVPKTRNIHQSALVIPLFVATGEDEKNEVKRICAGYDARFNVRSAQMSFPHFNCV